MSRMPTESKALIEITEQLVETDGSLDIYGQPSSSQVPQPSIIPCFEDSGYATDDDQERTVAFRPFNANECSSLSLAEPPKTPQKPAPQVSTDSAISMTFNQLNEAQPMRKVKDEEVENGSPLADRKARGHRTSESTLTTLPTRPAPTPIQNRTRRTYVPFDDPWVKLKAYLNKPLGSKDMEDGYIYGFQLDGCTYTKIGYAAQRKNKPSMEARMKQHERCGWADAMTVLRKEVPHAHRVEQIIHYHLEAGRMKEKCPIKGSN